MPQVNWSYNFDGKTSFQSVLDAVCGDHGLNAEHARLADHHNYSVLLDGRGPQRLEDFLCCSVAKAELAGFTHCGC